MTEHYFFSGTTLDKHCSFRHLQVRISQKFKCQWCPHKDFSGAQALQNHMSKHTGQQEPDEKKWSSSAPAAVPGTWISSSKYTSR
jgi:hypothetical protein